MVAGIAFGFLIGQNSTEGGSADDAAPEEAVTSTTVPADPVITSEPAAEEVVSYCKKNLAAYKVPKIIEFIDELPKLRNVHEII